MITEHRKEYLRKYQNRWIQNRRKEWIAKNGPCRKCGSSQDLEVDHIDRSTKVTHAVWSWSKERAAEELKKCQVLCKKCHRAKTNLELGKPFEHGANAYKSSKCRCSICREAIRISVYNWKKHGKEKV